MWVFYEAYDPRTQVLYLDLRDAALPQPLLGGPSLNAILLESFESTEAAHAFVDGYLQALHYDAKRVVKDVHCGGLRHPECKGFGGVCPRGLNDFYCEIRCGPRPAAT